MGRDLQPVSSVRLGFSAMTQPFGFKQRSAISKARIHSTRVASCASSVFFLLAVEYAVHGTPIVTTSTAPCKRSGTSHSSTSQIIVVSVYFGSLSIDTHSHPGSSSNALLHALLLAPARPPALEPTRLRPIPNALPRTAQAPALPSVGCCSTPPHDRHHAVATMPRTYASPAGKRWLVATASGRLKPWSSTWRRVRRPARSQPRAPARPWQCAPPRAARPRRGARGCHSRAAGCTRARGGTRARRA